MSKRDVVLRRVCALLFFVSPALAADPPRNVIVIGWDGCQRNHLKDMIAGNEVPNLMALAAEGKLVDVDVTTAATDTKAGWTQILTGYAPEKTGVYNNSRYQPIPEGYTVFERLENFFGPSNIDTVAVIGKKGHVDNDPPRRVPYAEWQAREQKQKRVDRAKPGRGNLQGGQVVEENGQKFVQVPGKPWFNASKTMDLFVNGLEQNERVAQLAMAEIEKRKDHRFFFFIHFAPPDHPGHGFGENSPEYTAGIRSDDEWTGKIIAKLKELGLYDRTLIYVTADHGFNEGQSGHSYAPYVFLATNDKLVTRDGNRMDVAPTVLKRFGLDLSTCQPALDGVPFDEPAPERKAPPSPPAGMAKTGKKKAQAKAPVQPPAEPSQPAKQPAL
jgi:predicted AlkP superfamily pyrophosphatase or phosphodiesterase